jgi:CheY-like chemotaxis protein
VIRHKSHGQGKGKTMRLLCVEDNATQRRMIDLMLASTGIDVDFASDGREAIDAWQINDYDAVLMDMEMPVMSGLKAVREIRQLEGGFHLGHTPILFLSGNQNTDQIDQGYEAGGDGHLGKPFTSAALIGALDGVMRAANRNGPADIRLVL